MTYYSISQNISNTAAFQSFLTPSETIQIRQAV
jgi:hypothetical protein